MRFFISILMVFFSFASQAQDYTKYIAQLESESIELDSLDKEWLLDNSSFLIDMAGLAEMDTTAMNKAIIQMSTKLLSNQLAEITDEEARGKKQLITKIIHGALDHHGLHQEKLLSAMSWYNMIVKEIGI